MEDGMSSAGGWAEVAITVAVFIIAPVVLAAFVRGARGEDYDGS
jgi:multisubunit Na+/H+ antiporter MnhG subunit